MTSQELTARAIKKAGQSICKYRVSAIGLNRKGEVVGAASNTPRFKRFHGGNHAEINLMRRALGRGLKTIVLCRINDSGKIKPIHPCAACLHRAEESGVQILSIHSEQ